MVSRVGCLKAFREMKHHNIEKNFGWMKQLDIAGFYTHKRVSNKLTGSAERNRHVRVNNKFAKIKQIHTNFYMLTKQKDQIPTRKPKLCSKMDAKR